ncbi:MAG: hypothetical protein ACLPIG_19165 [Methylocella sp.]
MEIIRPDDLEDIADLGLTLAEAKLLQARSGGDLCRASEGACRPAAEIGLRRFLAR